MKSFKTICVLALLAITFVACDKNEVLSGESSRMKSPHSAVDYNADFDRVAFAVNQLLLKSEKFRNLVHTEVGKKFDGNYNVLIKQLIEAHQYVTEWFAQCEVDIQSIVAKYPFIQIAILENYEKWNIEEGLPVVYLPYGYSQSSEESLVGYDTKGEKREFKKEELYKEIFAVVCENDKFVETYAPTEYNLNMRDFALIVNEAMQLEDFRKIVRDEAYKMFDGANDVLISTILGEVIFDGNEKISIRDFFNKSYAELLKKEIIDKNFSLDKLYETYPELQVSVPVNLHQMKDLNVVPPVTFITEEYEDGKQPVLYAYKGTKRIILDGINEPDFAVVVVGLNERMDRWKSPDGECPESVPGPQNLTVSTTTDGVLLMWNKGAGASVANTSGYQVYRKEFSATNPNSDFIHIQYLAGIDNLGFIDGTTIAGKTYLYYVKAVKICSISQNPENPWWFPWSINMVISDASNQVSIVTPPRPNAPLTFSAVQNSQNYVELNWALDPSQYVGQLEVFRNIEGNPWYNLMATINSNTYHYFDTDIQNHRGKPIRYAIQNVTPTGRSNPVYDYIHVSYRNPTQKSNVRITKIEVLDRAMEPWGMGPPEFRIKLMGANKNTGKSYEIGPTFYFDFKGTDLFGWNRTQTFNSLVCEWYYDVYETNYDVITFYVQETDKGKLKKLTLAGNIGIKASAGLNAANNSTTNDTTGNTTSVATSGVPFSVGASTEHALSYEVDFIDDEDMGSREYFYFENPNTIFEFNGVGRMKVHITQ
jgi:hypothetical protein